MAKNNKKAIKPKFKFNVGDPVSTPGEGHGVIKTQLRKGKYVVIFDGGVHEMISEGKLKLDKSKKVVLTDLKGKEIPPRWPIGYLVYHVDKLNGPVYRIMDCKVSCGSYEYTLIIDTPNGFSNGTQRHCMERELVSCRERAHMLRTNNEMAPGSEATDLAKRNENLRAALTEWTTALPGLTPEQARNKMDQLQADRNGMMDASNKSIAGYHKLVIVNRKLIEIVDQLTR